MRKSEAGSAGEFSGMLAVVTGAAQGIGRAIAELFHDRGARLLLLDRNAAGMEEAAAAMRATGRDDVDTAVRSPPLPESLPAAGRGWMCW
jgi:NAD(P)-dependent dehydrogenase (short-subunit alcohol dehydrogenase family)